MTAPEHEHKFCPFLHSNQHKWTLGNFQVVIGINYKPLNHELRMGIPKGSVAYCSALNDFGSMLKMLHCVQEDRANMLLVIGLCDW